MLAYGECIGSAVSGKEADTEVGLVYFGERYLVPRIGRWSTPDPLAIHAVGGSEAGNSYHYVSGNLLQARDPWGLEGDSPLAVDPSTSNSGQQQQKADALPFNPPQDAQTGGDFVPALKDAPERTFFLVDRIQEGGEWVPYDDDFWDQVSADDQLGVVDRGQGDRYLAKTLDARLGEFAESFALNFAEASVDLALDLSQLSSRLGVTVALGGGGSAGILAGGDVEGGLYLSLGFDRPADLGAFGAATFTGGTGIGAEVSGRASVMLDPPELALSGPFKTGGATFGAGLVAGASYTRAQTQEGGRLSGIGLGGLTLQAGVGLELPYAGLPVDVFGGIGAGGRVSFLGHEEGQ